MSALSAVLLVSAGCKRTAQPADAPATIEQRPLPAYPRVTIEADAVWLDLTLIDPMKKPVEVMKLDEGRLRQDMNTGDRDYLIAPLATALERSGAPSLDDGARSRDMLVVFHPNTPYATITRILYTVAQAGFDTWHFPSGATTTSAKHIYRMQAMRLVEARSSAPPPTSSSARGGHVSEREATRREGKMEDCIQLEVEISTDGTSLFVKETSAPVDGVYRVEKADARRGDLGGLGDPSIKALASGSGLNKEDSAILDGLLWKLDHGGPKRSPKPGTSPLGVAQKQARTHINNAIFAASSRMLPLEQGVWLSDSGTCPTIPMSNMNQRALERSLEIAASPGKLCAMGPMIRAGDEVRWSTIARIFDALDHVDPGANKGHFTIHFEDKSACEDPLTYEPFQRLTRGQDTDR